MNERVEVADINSSLVNGCQYTQLTDISLRQQLSDHIS